MDSVIAEYLTVDHSTHVLNSQLKYLRHVLDEVHLDTTHALIGFISAEPDKAILITTFTRYTNNIHFMLIILNQQTPAQQAQDILVSQQQQLPSWYPPPTQLLNTFATN